MQCPLKFQRESKNLQFFVVEHSTAILGINGSEKLGLVRVNFDTVECSIKLVHDIASDSFEKPIESDYPSYLRVLG